MNWPTGMVRYQGRQVIVQNETKLLMDELYRINCRIQAVKDSGDVTLLDIRSLVEPLLEERANICAALRELHEAL